MRKKRTETPQKEVIVLGAGFSAGLNFPLTSQLLPLALERIENDLKKLVIRVICFHFPTFSEKQTGSFPNIEELLTKIAVNEELWSASRSQSGRFKKKDLLTVRQELLFQISSILHERLANIPKQKWLTSFVRHAINTCPTIISFNWDLVLEKFLFGGSVTYRSYGLGGQSRKKPILLKPHGSLNWFEGSGAEFIRPDRISSLTADFALPPDYDEILLFKRLRSPSSKVERQYIPYIVPPTFLKRFEHPLLRRIWLKAIRDIGNATKLIFIGYSFPEYDHHSDFMFRCGLNNQTDGNLTRQGSRIKPRGPSQIVIVNRDSKNQLPKRMQNLLGIHRQKKPRNVQFFRRSVADWINGGGLVRR